MVINLKAAHVIMNKTDLFVAFIIADQSLEPPAALLGIFSIAAFSRRSFQALGSCGS